MQLSQWFHRQIRASTDGFLWAVEQIPPERHYLPPRPDRWSVARIVYHLLRYDQYIGLPTMRQWTGEERSTAGLTGSAEGDAALEEADWQQGEGHDMQSMLAALKALRVDQLTLLQQFPESAWSEERDALWGPVTLKWVVAKTYQHTLEHTDEILRFYLWWE